MRCLYVVQRVNSSARSHNDVGVTSARRRQLTPTCCRRVRRRPDVGPTSLCLLGRYSGSTIMSTKNSYAMRTIKITPNLLFEHQCTSGKFIRLPNRIEKNRFGSENRIESNRNFFCPNWNALVKIASRIISYRISEYHFKFITHSYSYLSSFGSLRRSNARSY